MATDPLRSFDGERYLNLETYRRDGSGVRTPLWFARAPGALVAMTNGGSYKVKRLRRDPAMRIAACNVRGKVHGPWFDGAAAIVTDAAAEERAYAALRAKYRLQWKVMELMARIGRRRGDWVILELKPS